MKLKTQLELVMIMGLVFMIGYTSNGLIARAQNTTTQYAPVVQSTDALYIAITGIFGSAVSLVIALANKNLLGKHSKEIGTNAVMAADANAAVIESRQGFKDFAQNTYDVIKIASPETAEAADKKIAPEMDKMTVKINEYRPKVDRYAAMANKTSDGGKKADSKIIDMKDDIPDNIVPS